MVRLIETDPELDPAPFDRDERLGEAIETFLALDEVGQAPSIEQFAAGYPELADDLVEALDGLALVRGLVGGPEGGHRLEEGRRVAGYRIVRELGRGGMGIVYEAVHVGLDRPVALKVLGGYATPDSSGRRRFLNEARTAAGLHHTHIVPVFDVGQVGGLCYYAMQRIEGCGLDRVLKQMRRDRSTAAGSTQGSGSRPTASTPKFAESPLHWSRSSNSNSGNLLVESGGLLVPPQDEDSAPFQPPRGSAYYRWVVAIGRQAAEALGHAHAAGVIHRDVKPSNLLVDARGTVWVADFGLARRLADPSQTQADSLLGTPRYMSPEQAKTGPIDGRSDVYSLGATLYELLTLQPPFDGQSAAELIEQIRLKEVAPLRKWDPRIPRDLETIVLKCLAKRPADRYASAIELAADLGRYLAMEPVRARRIGPIGRAWRFARRHPAVAGVSTVATIAVLSTATYAYVRVVAERDLAIIAQGETQIQRDRALYAGAETKAAMASLKRFASDQPDRRAAGLDLLKDAAEQTPADSPLRLRLRDEAIEFLALRDVITQPPVVTGPTRGLVYGPNDRVVTLAEDGQSVSFWDLSHGGNLLQTRDLPSSEQRYWPRGAQFSAITMTGPTTAAVIWGNGHGVRIFDMTACNPTTDLDIAIPDHQVIGIFGAPVGGRFVTIEAINDRLGSGTSANGANPRRRSGPDRSRLVVNLWDITAPTHPPITLGVIDPDEARQAIPLVAISPNGELVATSLLFRPDITLWSARDGSKRKTLETQHDVTALGFGPNGLLAAAESGSIRLWDTHTMAPLPGVTPRLPFVFRLRFSPDGGLLAVRGWGNEVEIWDPSANAMVVNLKPSEAVVDMTFAPTGRRLAVAGTEQTLSLWEIDEPVARVRLGGFAQEPTSLAFGKDGTLAVASREAPPRLWQPDEPPVGRSLAGLGSPTTLAFDPTSGKLVTFDSNARVLRWSDPTQVDQPPTQIKLPKPSGRSMGDEPIAWSTDGKTMVLFTGSDEIYLWSNSSPKTIRSIVDPASEPADPLGRGNPPRTVPGQRPAPVAEVPPRPAGAAPAESPSNPQAGPRRPGPNRVTPYRNGRQLAIDPSGKRLYLVGTNSGELRVWNLESNQAKELAWPSLVEDVTDLALSDDGQMLALIDRAGSVTLVDPVLKEVITKLVPPSGGVFHASVVAFAPGGDELAVGTRAGMILVWSLGGESSSETTLTLRLASHRGNVTTLAYNLKGDRLASGGVDKSVDIWNLNPIRTELNKIGLGW